jgi:hypothetical protein
VNRAPAMQVSAPLRDLIFEDEMIGGRGHAGLTFSQMPRNVSSTTCHCSR